MCAGLLAAASASGEVPNGFITYSKGDAYNRTLYMVTLKPGMTEAQVRATETRICDKGSQGGDIEGQISFDGQWMAFARSDGCTAGGYGGNDYHQFGSWDIYIVKLHERGARPIRIGDGYWPSWGLDSYNETKTLYYSTHGGRASIRTVTVDSDGRASGNREVTPISNAGNKRYEGFGMCSPSGTFVAGRWSGKVYVWHFAGPLAGRHLGGRGGCHPSISADGKWIVNAMNQRQRFDGSRGGTVSGDGAGEYHYGSSPDVKWFVCRTKGSWKVQNCGRECWLFKLAATETDFATKRQIKFTDSGSWVDVHAWTKPPPPPRASAERKKKEERPGRTAAKKATEAAVQEALPGWDAKLLAMLKARLAAGKKPRFRLASMRATMRVTKVGDDGALRLSSGPITTQMAFSRLSLAEKKSLALAVADRKSPGDCAVAAFYLLAVGEEKNARTFLRTAGDKAAAVRAIFE